MSRASKPSRRVRNPLVWVAWAILALLVGYTVWSASLAFQIWMYDSSGDPNQRAEAAVVLGAQTVGDEPSPVFRERIVHAIELYETGRVSMIIATGGTARDGESSEARVAADVLRDAGVPDSAIFLEEVSRSTYENLVEVRRVAEAQGISTLLIVSDPLHMRRAIAIAQDLGLDARPSATPTSRIRSLSSRISFVAREAFAYGGYLLCRFWSMTKPV